MTMVVDSEYASEVYIYPSKAKDEICRSMMECFCENSKRLFSFHADHYFLTKTVSIFKRHLAEKVRNILFITTPSIATLRDCLIKEPLSTFSSSSFISILCWKTYIFNIQNNLTRKPYLFLKVDLLTNKNSIKNTFLRVTKFIEVRNFSLKVHQCRFENLPRCSCLCKSNAPKISHSQSY